MSIARTVASLRVTTTQLRVGEISSALATQPSYFQEKGEPITPERPEGPFYDTTIWMLRARISGYLNMAEQIAWILEFVEARQSQVAQLRETGTIDIYCACEQLGDGGRIAFPSDIIRRVGEASVAIIVEVYSVGDAEA